MKKLIDVVCMVVMVLSGWLVASALSGCAEVEPQCGAGVMCERELRRELTLSSAYDENQREGFERAAKQWNEATGGERVAITWRVVDGPADFEPAGPGCNYSGPQLGIGIHDTQLAVMHALGHRFGLEHADLDNGFDDLMDLPSPSYSTFLNELSARDVERFDQLWQERRP